MTENPWAPQSPTPQPEWHQPQPSWSPPLATPQPAPWTVSAHPPERRRTGAVVAGSIGVLGVATAVVVGVTTSATVTGTATAGTTMQNAPSGTFGRDGFGGFGSSPFGSGSSGSGSSGSAGSGSSSSSATTTATADQQIGVVDIDTVLGYAGAEAAGTGMVLTANGEVLTNNHVVDGATKISVTVVSSGATYRATVVGTDPGDDVAVLQLSGASDLQVADFSSTAAALGDAVTAVGNAGGTGGTPSAVSGTITAVEQSITATDQAGGDAEQLSGLLETDADLAAGDSGGPLYDTSSGRIVGMDTAASSGPNVVGYAIPIDTALSIASEITHGVDNATVHQGYPAFLGVSVSPNSSGGALIAGVVSGGPAASAGLVAGDTVTAVDGTAIASRAALTAALGAHDPGDTVSVTWTDTSGAAHTAQVTLATGPAD